MIRDLINNWLNSDLYINFKFVRKMIIFKYLICILAGIKLKKICNNYNSLEEYFNIANTFEYSVYKKGTIIYNFFRRKLNTVTLYAEQNESELARFIKIYARTKPKVILEIGTYRGGTFFLLCRFSRPDALLISMDLPSGNLRIRTTNFFKSFAWNRQKVIILRKDSHKLSTLQLLKKKLKDRLIDVLLIDGDHSYEGVKKDFEIYSPFVKKGGIIAFHDISKISKNRELIEVKIFWDEIKDSYRYIEICEGDKYGIGVLFKD